MTADQKPGTEQPKRAMFSDLDRETLAKLLLGGGMMELPPDPRPRTMMDVLLDRIERAAYLNGASESAVADATRMLDVATEREAELRLQVSKLEEARGAQDAEIGILKQRIANHAYEMNEALPKLAELHSAAESMVTVTRESPKRISGARERLRVAVYEAAGLCNEVPF